MMDGRGGADDRVLLVGLTRKDAELTAGVLRQAGISSVNCRDIVHAIEELDRGAAVVLAPEEAVSNSEGDRMAEVIATQPAWSDLPVLILAHEGADSTVIREAVRTLGNVTLLERPLRVATLLSAVTTAGRARQRQYQIREHLTAQASAEAALRAADQRKDEFLATLGHELRNPLAPLLSGLHFLRLKAPADPAIAHMLEVMERQISHLTRLVDDLMEVSRITRGLVDVRHDPLDLIAVVSEALEASRPTMISAGHTVRANFPTVPVGVRGDGVRLAQVFSNLLTNAAKYTNRGGHIEITMTVDDAKAIVSVRDNGIGIAPENLGAVFDMFMQVDRSNRHAQGGLGIGLTLVRSLVEMHGGSVTAKSAGASQGSEFTVTLPLLMTPSVGKAEPTLIRDFPDRRILVVDDNRDAADTLGALLQALGATVSVANSGRAALAALDDFHPDTILLDIGMPEMSGYDVARQVRLLPKHQKTLLIALTGWGQAQDFQHSKEAGFDHHLVKPPDIDKLRSYLSR